jgi:glycosyltransferase involved in cell wall biosynthesis
MYTVVIPAHNEARVIQKTLLTLLQGATSHELEIIVVCNGCTDNTANIVRSFGPPVLLLESPVASKAAALNIGDREARGFPRFYLDADVELRIEAIRKTSAALQEGKLLAASPAMQMDLAGSSWAVRAFYRIWSELPYCRDGMIGTGVYALSKMARRRFDCFPDIIADDGYVRALFREDERGVVPGCVVRVKSPATLKGLIKIFTRARLGRYELQRDFPHLLENEQKKYGDAILQLLKKPLLFAEIAVYFCVNLICRIRARRQFQQGRIPWERDESSRQIKGSV